MQIALALCKLALFIAGTGLGNFRGPFQPQSFCNSVIVRFLTVLVQAYISTAD